MLAPLLALITFVGGIMAVPNVLVYTATAGFRHDSIPTAIEVLGEQASAWNVTFEFTEDRTQFNDDRLSQFDAVMFVHNSEDILDDSGKAALKKFFQSGGVYTGVHGASACLFNDPTYLQAVGALFDYHPELQPVTFLPINDTFPATANLPDRWSFEEEVYNFRSDPREQGAVVVLTVDEGSYTHDGMSVAGSPNQGSPHPIAWYIESPQSAQPLLDGASKAGRSFYTSLGHLNSTWRDETFINHVMSGLQWALEGASTRAYGAGLVGSTNTTNSSGTSPSASASPSGAAGTSSSPSGTASQSAPSPSGTGAASLRAAAGSSAGLLGVGIAAALAVGVKVVL